MEKRPKITIMGEEIPWDEVPTQDSAVEIADYFKPVKLSLKAVNEASKIVPAEHWVKIGICNFLQPRADYVFSKLTSDQREGRLKAMKYFFEFDSDGPLLKNVSL